MKFEWGALVVSIGSCATRLMAGGGYLRLSARQPKHRGECNKRYRNNALRRCSIIKTTKKTYRRTENTKSSIGWVYVLVTREGMRESKEYRVAQLGFKGFGFAFTVLISVWVPWKVLGLKARQWCRNSAWCPTCQKIVPFNRRKFQRLLNAASQPYGVTRDEVEVALDD